MLHPCLGPLPSEPDALTRLLESAVAAGAITAGDAREVGRHAAYLQDVARVDRADPAALAYVYTMHYPQEADRV